MNLVVTAVVLAIVAALIDHLFGMKDPWRKIVYAGCIILFVVGLVLMVLPGPWI